MKNLLEDSKKRLIIFRILLLLLLIVVIIVVFSLLTFNKNEKGSLKEKEEKIEENTNKNVISNKNIEDFSISDVKIKIINGLTTFTAKATNTSSEVKNIKGFNVYFTNKEENDMGMISIYIDGEINPGASVDLINYSDLNLKDAKSIKYEIITESNSEQVEENTNDVVIE